MFDPIANAVDTGTKIAAHHIAHATREGHDFTDAETRACALDVAINVLGRFQDDCRQAGIDAYNAALDAHIASTAVYGVTTPRDWHQEASNCDTLLDAFFDVYGIPTVDGHGNRLTSIDRTAMTPEILAVFTALRSYQDRAEIEAANAYFPTPVSV